MTLERLRDFIRPLTNAVLIGFLVLVALACGILEAVMPGVGLSYAAGMAAGLRAFPPEYYALGGAGIVTYTAAREVGKYVEARKPQVDNPDGEP